MLINQTILWIMWRSWEDREIASDWEILRRFAKTNKIIYVDLQQKFELLRSNGRLSWKDYFFSFRFRAPEWVEDNILRIKTPPMLPLFISLLSRVLKEPVARLSIFLSKRILKKRIQSSLAKLGLSPTILWIHSPFDFPLVGEFGERMVCYRTSDEVCLYPENLPFQNLLDDLERKNINKVHLVFASSRSQLLKRKKMHSHTYLFPNGVDSSFFNKALTKPDIPHIKPPVIGFMGVIDHRFDFRFMEKIARLRPSWSFVIIGLIRKHCSDKMSNLTQLTNVHWLGEKSRSELPSYLRMFDAGIIPYLITPFTNTIFPWKVNEYLATGMPVISTALKEIECLAPLVRIARSAEEAVDILEFEIKHDSSERQNDRILFASKNSWDIRVKEMQSLIKKAGKFN